MWLVDHPGSAYWVEWRGLVKLSQVDAAVKHAHHKGVVEAGVTQVDLLPSPLAGGTCGSVAGHAKFGAEILTL